MSTGSIPPPPLNILEQHNQSKSTVSSSDTDVDWVGYASSSGTTTPEDDTHVFGLGHGPMFQPALTDKSRRPPREKLTLAMKHRNFNLAVKKVKKAVHALAAFKRKRPDDISPILISSPLRERFGKRMSIKPHPEESFYSLPNRRFSLSDASTPPHHTITRKFGTISGSTPNIVKSKRQRSGLPSFPDQLQSNSPSASPATVIQTMGHAALAWRTNMVHALRILLFVPWCAAVGGALLLFPSYVDFVAFRTGYLESPKGIRRFAHWAECGQQHVMIFLAPLIIVLWYDLALGLSLTSIIVSRFMFVWRSFEVDNSIPLGEDDQQSLYLAITGLAFANGSFSTSGMKGGQAGTELDESVEEDAVTGA